jgi:hypothetical protein
MRASATSDFSLNTRRFPQKVALIKPQRDPHYCGFFNHQHFYTAAYAEVLTVAGIELADHEASFPNHALWIGILSQQ